MVFSEIKKYLRKTLVIALKIITISVTMYGLYSIIPNNIKYVFYWLVLVLVFSVFISLVFLKNRKEIKSLKERIQSLEKKIGAPFLNDIGLNSKI